MQSSAKSQQLVAGSRVIYVGSDPHLQQILDHQCLEVRMVRKQYATCIQANGYLSPWIPTVDLQRVVHQQELSTQYAW